MTSTLIDLHFLGCGAAFNPLMKNTSAYFEIDALLCLIDCGESSFEQIYAQKLFTGKKAVLVFLSHLHSDHVGSLASLISYAAYVLHIRVYVVHPIDSVVRMLDLLGIKHECYEYFSSLPEKIAPELDVTPIPVVHVNNMHCFGYIIKTPDWQIYYSGDSASLDKMVIEKLKKGEIQKIYQDTCSKSIPQSTHCSLQELKNLVPPELRSKVYCMHFDTDFTEQIKQNGFKYVSPVTQKSL